MNIQHVDVTVCTICLPILPILIVTWPVEMSGSLWEFQGAKATSGAPASQLQAWPVEMTNDEENGFLSGGIWVMGEWVQNVQIAWLFAMNMW